MNLTNIIEKNKYPPKWTCSVFSSSLIGFLIKTKTSKTTEIPKKERPSLIPKDKDVPSKLDKYTIAIGTPLLIDAATRASPKGAIISPFPCPILTIEIINVNIYTIIFLTLKSLRNISEKLIFSLILSLSSW